MKIGPVTTEEKLTLETAENINQAHRAIKWYLSLPGLCIGINTAMGNTEGINNHPLFSNPCHAEHNSEKTHLMDAGVVGKKNRSKLIPNASFSPRSAEQLWMGMAAGGSKAPKAGWDGLNS